jgi:peptidyl-prolyl cis-trans isomerase C
MRGPLPVELPAAKRRQLQYEALGLLMDNVLMEQFLRKSGPRIDEAEVNKRLTELEQSIKKAGKTLTDYYKESKQTETQVRQALLQMLQWETYARARLNDVDIKRYYDENKDFFDGVTVRASHILLRIARTSADAERQANRQKLLAIRQEIISGQVDFAAAAKKYSQCPSAAEGGDIGSFPRKMVVDESFAKAAFALAVGQVSDVVATDFGLHLIKVTERKAGDKPSEFEKIKDVVRDFCIEELRQVILAQQRTAAKIEVFLRQS